MSKKAKTGSPEVSATLGDLSALPRLEFKTTAYGREEGQGVMIAARQLPGFPGAIGLTASALGCHADRIWLEYTTQAVGVRFRVDGRMENMPPLDRPTGDSVLVVLKRLCGMNPNDRRSRQDGKCACHLNGVDWLISMSSQGLPSGERVILTLAPKKPHLKTLVDLGMREKMQETLKGYLNGQGGMVVISAPAGAGLPTTWSIALEAADKFVRDFVTLEDAASPEPEIINVSKVLFDLSANETPEKVLERRILRQPDVFVMPQLYNESVVGLLVKEMTKESRHVIVREVASDAIEALISLVKKFPAHAKEYIPLVHAVLNQRLMRRLCDKCKQPFQPSPQLLQKLGLPADQISKLYQPFVPPPPEQRVDAKGSPIEIQICRQCNGRGYFGRMAIFELLELTDEFRAALMKNQDPEFLRPIAARLGHRNFQDEAILAVARGLTSLQELQLLMQAKPRA